MLSTLDNGQGLKIKTMSLRIADEITSLILKRIPIELTNKYDITAVYHIFGEHPQNMVKLRLMLKEKGKSLVALLKLKEVTVPFPVPAPIYDLNEFASD